MTDFTCRAVIHILCFVREGYYDSRVPAVLLRFLAHLASGRNYSHGCNTRRPSVLIDGLRGITEQNVLFSKDSCLRSAI